MRKKTPAEIHLPELHLKKRDRIILIILAIALAALLEWLLLLPLNVQTTETAVLAMAVILLCTWRGEHRRQGMIAAGAVLAAVIVFKAAYSPLLNAGAYAARTTVTDSDFAADVQPVDVSSVPLVDKESSQVLGDRKMGELPAAVSQFDVSDQYNQITYQGRLYRVTPLEYSGLIKWINNRSTGTPGYILVDSSTGAASVVKVPGGMKYMPSAYFNEDLGRHIFLKYPTALTAASSFEIDESGAPFWITPVLKVRGIYSLPDVKGVIITSATDGTMTYCPIGEVPEWVDHAYPSELIEDQINSVLMYQKGYWNTVFGQNGVRKLTPSFTDESTGISYTGYQYIPTDGVDISLYSGVTSLGSDESNLGFVIANLRTGRVRYYASSGAEEYSAINSAQGAVQEKGYVGTFPLLVNVDGRPTYLLSLKDNAGLVKAYAFVDCEDYQKVTVTSSEEGIEAALRSYRRQNGSAEAAAASTVTITIAEIHSAVVDGNTIYYLLGTDGNIYTAAIKVSQQLPFLKEGDVLQASVSDGTILSIQQ